MSKKIAVLSAEGLALEALLEHWQESEIEACSPVLLCEEHIGETVLFKQRPIAFQSHQEFAATGFDLIIAFDVDTEQQAWLEQATCPIVASFDVAQQLDLPQVHVVANAELLALQALLADTPCTVKGSVLMPASLHGKQGVDALASQTVDLLSGKPPKRGRLKQQLSFNAFPLDQQSYQEKLQQQLQLLNLAQSINLAAVQVSVFHGIGMQLWLEFNDAAAVAEVMAQWQSNPLLKVCSAKSNSSIYTASQNAAVIEVAQLTVDQTSKQGISLWLAFDGIQIFIKQVLISAVQLLPKHD